MQLNRSTDLGLRVLLYVAQAQSQRRRITTREIVVAYRVSHEHLRKVVHRLASEGLLVTERGRAGGIRLGGPAASIRVGEVVARLEPDLAIVDCATQRCILRGPCSLKAALTDAAKAFVAVLDRYTLADLVGEPAMRPRLLRLVNAGRRWV